MRHDSVAPVEETVAVLADQDVSAVEVVVLDGGRDAESMELLGLPFDGGHLLAQRAPSDGTLLAFIVGEALPPRVLFEQPCQLPGEYRLATVRGAGSEHRRDRVAGLKRALQLRVLGEDPLPRREIVVAGAVGARLAKGRSGIVEQQPRPIGVDGKL